MGKQKYPNILEEGMEFNGWIVVKPEGEKNTNRIPANWFYECKCEVCGNVKAHHRGFLLREEIARCNHITIRENGRTCTVCLEFKDWDDFNKQKNGVNQHSGCCRQCSNEKRTKIRIADGMKPRADWKIDEYGRECIVCGIYKKWPKFYKYKGGNNNKSSKCISCSIDYYYNNVSTGSSEYKYKKKWDIDNNGRKCVECNTYKTWSSFGINSMNKYGHRSMCLECAKIKDTRRRREKGVKATHKCIIDIMGRECTICREYMKWDEYGKSSNGTNGHKSSCKKCMAKKDKERKKNNREKTNATSRKWREKNKDRINKEERERRKNDLEYKIKKNLRCRVNVALKDQNADKKNKTFDLIGCSPSECILYLEVSSIRKLKFEDPNNDVDHIIPCNYFDLTNEIEQYMCFNYRNLQLLPHTENTIKNIDLPPFEELKERIFELFLAVLEEKPFKMPSEIEYAV